MDYRPLTLLSVLALVACGGGSGSNEAPLPQPPASRITFNDGGALDAQKTQIEQLVDEVFVAAGAELAIDQVSVLVSADAARTIPGWGMGGYALSPDEIELVIDPLTADLGNLLAARLPHIIAHELHHTVRLRDPGFYITLRDALVFEAMADHFALALLDGDLPPWTTAFDEADTPLYRARAEPELDQPFNFEAWFFGIGTDLPRWTGYTLGYRILRDHFEANPQDSASVLVNAAPEFFFPPEAL